MTRQAAILLLLCASASTAAMTVMLAWDYAEPKTNIVFEVWRSVDLKNWQLYDLTTATNFPISITGTAGFFKVMAQDTSTGEASGCAVSIQLPTCAVQSMTLAWDASPDPAATGYNVYYGVATGAYTNRVSVGDVRSTTISNLVSGVTYYFVVKAHNTIGLESHPSNEAFWNPPQ